MLKTNHFYQKQLHYVYKELFMKMPNITLKEHEDFVQELKRDAANFNISDNFIVIQPFDKNDKLIADVSINGNKPMHLYKEDPNGKTAIYNFVIESLFDESNFMYTLIPNINIDDFDGNKLEAAFNESMKISIQYMASTNTQLTDQQASEARKYCSECYFVPEIQNNKLTSVFMVRPLDENTNLIRRFGADYHLNRYFTEGGLTKDLKEQPKEIIFDVGEFPEVISVMDSVPIYDDEQNQIASPFLVVNNKKSASLSHKLH